MTIELAVHHRILATAGHVDHGKSSLVRALTGMDPDRLPDEKRRGMTIDLGFASLALDDPVVRARYHLGIVDVPGHEDFIRNMIAGVGSIDLALLVVAADDGWMPQTDEHLRILCHLRAPALVVAITKADLRDDVQPLADDIRARLRNTPYADAWIVPVSARTGAGLEELRAALLRTLQASPPPADVGKPRLFIDRVFTLQGAGTVVTGTLAGGQLRPGQHVALHPFPRQAGSARIRAIQSHNRPLDVALPSTRVALNLVDIRLPHAVAQLARGHVVTLPALADASCLIDIVLTPNASLRHHQAVWVHHATTSSRARLVLHPDVPRLAQLRLEHALLPFIGDQLLLRDPSARQTLAGGTILRVHAERHRFVDDPLPSLVHELVQEPNDPARHLQLAFTDHPGTPHDSVLSASHRSADTLQAAIVHLRSSGQLAEIPGAGTISGAFWQYLHHRLTESVTRFHRQHPEQPGIPFALLVKQLPALPPAFFQALLNLPDFLRHPSSLALRSHHSPPPLHLAPLCRSILETLQRTGLNPPCRSELAPQLRARHALQHLIDRRDVIPLNADILLAASHFEAAKTRILAYLHSFPEAPIPELKAHLQTTRRVLIPLLELLDRTGVTRRSGNLHVLKNAERGL